MEKPKRPLSAYNYFFRHERKQLLGPDFVEKEESSELKRRVHRKTHGKYSFSEMARVIAKKWKDLDEDARFQFEDLAAEDKQRYKQQMKIWKKSSKQEQQEYNRGPEKLQQNQEHLWKQVSVKNNKNGKLNPKDNAVETVIAGGPLPSSGSLTLKASPEMDEGKEESEIPKDNALRKLMLSGRKSLPSDYCRQETASERSEMMLRKLILQNRGAPPSVAMSDCALSRNAVTSASASAHTAAALSSLVDRSAMLRTLADDGDNRTAAAALNAINAQRIHEEKLHQARRNELLRRQILDMESHGGSNGLNRTRTGQDPLVHLRTDHFSHDFWQYSNFIGPAPSDILALNSMTARLRASTAPLSHPLQGSPTPGIEMIDSKFGHLREREM